VTLTIGTGPEGAVLSGGGPVTVVDGVATFANLRINEPGTYTLHAEATSTVDEDGVADPTPAGATSAPFNITSAAAADLVISAPTTLTVTPNSVAAGGTVTLSAFTVTNQGTASSNFFSHGFYLSTDATITATDDVPLTGAVRKGMLAAGGSYDWEAQTLTIPAGTAPGSYFIGILVDDFNTTPESDEANNFKSTALDITAASNVWTTKAPMPTARGAFGVGVVNGILYAVGGFNSISILGTLEAYDPITNTWTTMAPMPTARDLLGVGVVNGILYAVGGYTANGGDQVATVEAYDPATNSWTTKAPMPAARGELAVGVANGILYAIGGFTGGSYVGTVEAYDPTTNSWTTKASMRTARGSFNIGVVNGVLYAIGGFGGPAAVEAYDPVTNTWTTKASKPTGVGDVGVGVLDGIVYAVGGFFSGFFATVEAYDPVSNTWTTKASLPTATAFPGVGVVNGVLYAVGGSAVGGFVSTNQAYQP
jgi:hypothetical protein